MSDLEKNTKRLKRTDLEGQLKQLQGWQRLTEEDKAWGIQAAVVIHRLFPGLQVGLGDKNKALVFGESAQPEEQTNRRFAFRLDQNDGAGFPVPTNKDHPQTLHLRVAANYLKKRGRPLKEGVTWIHRKLTGSEQGIEGWLQSLHSIGLTSTSHVDAGSSGTTQSNRPTVTAEPDRPSVLRVAASVDASLDEGIEVEQQATPGHFEQGSEEATPVERTWNGIHSEEKLLSTKELAEATAGGDDYIRTKDNIVKGLALRSDVNPNAPSVVAYGSGPQIMARATRFLEQGTAVPTYLKRDVNAWAFVGYYRAIKNLTDKTSIRKYAAHWPAGSVAGVLLLERTDVEEIDVRGGGFADAETRKAVERAAVDHVIEVLEAEGFDVEDRQAENCGFDLLATRDGECLEVEVKGTSGVARNFFITRNETQHAEKSAKEFGNWRLYLVTSALDKPTLHRYTWSELQDSFEMKALAWQCKAKESQALLKDNAE